jgi:hypothetical protein
VRANPVTNLTPGEPLHIRYFYTGIRVLAPYKKRVPNPQLVSKRLYGVRTRLGHGKNRTCSGSTREWQTLRSGDFNVRCVNNGSDAVDIMTNAKHGDYAFIIMDYQMVGLYPKP